MTESNDGILLDSVSNDTQVLMREALAQYDTAFHGRHFHDGVVQHQGVNQGTADASVFREFFLNVVLVIPAVTGNLNIEFVPDIIDILEECSLGPVFAIFVQSGTVPFSVDFFVSDSVRTPDGVDKPDISSNESP